MRVLVTGGGGFIGSHTAEKLISLGHEVRVVDRDPRWPVAGAEWIRADLADPGVAAAAVDGVDAVSHQAARVGLGVSYADAPGYVADNPLATAHLLAALAARRFDGRLVLASSMVVYGEGRYTCDDHGVVAANPRRGSDLESGRFDPTCSICGAPLSWALVDEDAALLPRSVYAASKLAQEHLTACWVRESGAPSAVALRYHNVYGRRLPFDTPYAGVAALWCSSLRAGDPPRVFEDGRQTRDFVHVSDVVAANVAAISAALPSGSFEAVNVCSGRPATILEVASGLCQAFGPEAPKPVVTGQYRMGDVRHVVASPVKAETLLGFKAEMPLAAGLADLAEWSGEGPEPAEGRQR